MVTVPAVGMQGASAPFIGAGQAFAPLSGEVGNFAQCLPAAAAAVSLTGCTGGQWVGAGVAAFLGLTAAGYVARTHTPRKVVEAFKGLLPHSFRMRNIPRHDSHIYSHEDFNDGHGTVAEPMESYLTAVVREGTIDIRDIRLIHCLLEGDGSDIVGRKLYDMRKILSEWKRKHPRTWKDHRADILEAMTNGDSYRKTGRIQVAQYLDPTGIRQHALLLVNGQRRLATLALLAARGDIPVSWLTAIPVHVHLISRPEQIRKITSGRYLPHEEVFGEILTAPRPHWWKEDVPAWLKRHPSIFRWLDGKVRKKHVKDERGNVIERRLFDMEVGRRRSPAEVLKLLEKVPCREFRQDRSWLDVENWQAEEAAIIFRLVREGVISKEEFFRVMSNDPIFSQRVFDERRLAALESHGWFARAVEHDLTGRSPGKDAADALRDRVKPLWLKGNGDVREYLSQFIRDDSLFPETLRSVIESGYVFEVYTKKFKMDEFVADTTPEIRITTVVLSKFQPIKERLYFLLRLLKHETNPNVIHRITQTLKATAIEAAQTDMGIWATSEEVSEFWKTVSRHFKSCAGDPGINRGWAKIADWLFLNASGRYMKTIPPGVLSVTIRPGETQWFFKGAEGDR